MALVGPFRMPSNRAPSAFQQYMQRPAPANPASGLAAIRSSALRTTGQSPVSTIAMRQANTQGPPQVTQEDLRGLTNEYNNWANRMRAQGWTEEMIARSPMFEQFQTRLLAAVKQVNDPKLIDQNITDQQSRIDREDPRNPIYSPSATTVRDAFTARKAALAAAAAPAAPATPSVDTTGIPYVGGYVGDNIDLSGIPAYQPPAAPAAPSAPPAIASEAPQAYSPAPLNPMIRPEPMVDRNYGSPGPAADGIADVPPINMTNVRPMPLLIPSDMGDVGAALDHNNGPMNMGVAKPMPMPKPDFSAAYSAAQGAGQQSAPVGQSMQYLADRMSKQPASPGVGASTPSVGQIVGASPPREAQSPSSPSSGLGGVMSGAGNPGMYDSPHQLDDKTRAYMSGTGGVRIGSRGGHF